MPEGVIRDGYVQMLDAQGLPVEVPQESVQEAFSKGYTPQTPEQVQRRDIERERGTLGQQALTLGEAALSTATLGLSDIVGADISPEWKQATRERRQVNPNITLAGEITGAVAPALLTGGTSAAARGLSTVATPLNTLGRLGAGVESAVAAGGRALGLTGQSVASRAALQGLKMAASGAVEGGAFEITRGVVDSVLNDTDYTVERLTADISKGVKWGAIGGGVVGVGSTLVGAAGRRAVDSMLGGKNMDDALRDFAERRAAKSAAGSLQDIAGKENRIGRKLLDAQIPLNRSKQAIKAIDDKADEAVGKMRAVAQEIDAAGVRVPVQDIAKRLDDQLTKLSSGATKENAAAFDKVRRALARTREAPTWEGVVAVRSKIDDLIRKAPDSAVKELRTLRTTVDESLLESTKLVADDALLTAAAQGDEVAQATVAAQMGRKEQLVRAIDDARDWNALQVVRKEVDDVGGVVNTAGDVFTGLAFLKGLAYGGLGVIPGMAVSAAAGLARGQVRKFVQERGGGWLARIADQVSRSNRRIDRASRAVVGGTALRERAGVAAIKGSAGVIGEPDWTGSLAEQLVSGAGAAQPPAPPAAALRKVAQAGNYKERYEQLKQQLQVFRGDPREAASILEASTGEMAAIHPEIAMAVHQQTLADAAYLDSLMPTGTTTGLNPMTAKPVVNRYEQQRLVDVADALNDPPSVLEALADGKLNMDQWAALEARRPKLYQEMRQRVIQEYMQDPDSVPFRRRVTIGTALNFPADWSMLPGTLAEIQQLSDQTGAAPPAQPGPAPVPDIGSETAEQLETPSQMALGAR